MLARIHSAGLYGIDAYPVEVEVNISQAEFSRVALVGLPDTAVKESIERVCADDLFALFRQRSRP